MCRYLIHRLIEVTLGKIELYDEGHGMSLQDIEEGWLVLSNSKKKKLKKEKYKTPKYGRIPLGEKGLGRLSVQRLGRITRLTSKREKDNVECIVVIAWFLYDNDITIEKKG